MGNMMPTMAAKNVLYHSNLALFQDMNPQVKIIGV